MALRTLARRGLEETVVRARGGGATTTTATTGTIAGAWLRFRSDDATTTTTTTGEAGTREANATAEAKATIETLGSEGAPTEERKTRRRKPPTKETAAAGKDGGATSAKKKRAKKLELSPKEDSNVYVKNMPLGVDATMLKESFRKFGPILSVKPLNPEGPWPGGLVRFVRAEHAQKAIEAASEGGMGVIDGAPGPVVLRLASKRAEGDDDGASGDARAEEAQFLSSLVGEDGEPLDPVATAAALEKRKAELADRRRLRAEKLASQTEKAREMSAARRAERVAAGRENIKTFVPRYKRGSGGAGADLKLDPSLRASTTSRRMKDGAMAVGIARRRPPRANAGGRQRRGDGQDAKIQQALNDKIRQARQLQESNETYDYDRNEFDRQSFLLTHEKFDVRRILEKPRLGSDSPAMSDEERFDANKSWLMELAGVKSEQEFAYLKAEALEARAQQRDYDRLMRKRAGLSPFTDNFLAERASLEAVVSTVSADNILHEMSKLAVDTLDSNPYMKYADKIRLLEKLEREASALADVRAADL